MRRSAALAPVLVAVALVVPAGAQELVDVTQFGTRRSDEAWGVAWLGADLVVAGRTSGTLPGQERRDGADAFVRRMSSDGTEVWAEQFGSRRDDVAQSIASDGATIYAAGTTLGTLPGQTHLGANDGFVRAYDADGAVLWTVQFGTGRDDFVSGVAIAGGEVFVALTTFGRFDGEPRIAGADAAVVAFDADGQQLWVDQFGSDGQDQARAVADGSGGLVVAGAVIGRLEGRRRGNSDAFARMYDTSGAVVWTEQFGTRGFDGALGVASVGSTVYVGGSTHGAFRGEDRRGRFDAFVRAFDGSDGSAIWTEQFGTRDEDHATGLAADADGVYATGWTFGGFAGFDNRGRADAFAVALDPSDGSRLWKTQFGTRGYDYADAAALSTGALAISGGTTGRFTGGTARGDYDAFAALLDVSP